MRTFLHSCRITAWRFRFELLAFILLSLGISITLALGTNDPPSLGDYPSLPGPAVLEKVVAVWIILRLMCSMPVLLTEGGWRTRPIPRWVAWGSSVAVLAMVLTLLLLARLWATWYITRPDSGQWQTIFLHYILPDAFTVVAVSTILRVAASLAPNRQGAVKRLPLVLTGLVALISWTSLFSSEFFAETEHAPWTPTRYQLNERAAIRMVLPEDAVLFGDWSHGTTWPLPAREVLRIPLEEGLVIRRPGLKMKLHLDSSRERNLRVDISLTFVEGRLWNQIWNSTMVVRYPGNQFSISDKHPEALTSPDFAFNPVKSGRIDASFLPPSDQVKDEAHWQRTLSGAELIFYYPDPLLPRFQVEALEPPLSPGLRPPHRNAQSDPIPGDVEGIFRRLDFELYRVQEPREPWLERVKRLGPAVMREVLDHKPWSDHAWTLFVKPYLLEYSADADKAALLERLRDDPRLGEIFITKGWKADAMPLLRGFAKDRLPIGLASITALLEEKDPTLAADLGSLLMRLEEGDEVAQLEPAAEGIPRAGLAGLRPARLEVPEVFLPAARTALSLRPLGRSPRRCHRLPNGRGASGEERRWLRRAAPISRHR